MPLIVTNTPSRQQDKLKNSMFLRPLIWNPSAGPGLTLVASRCVDFSRAFYLIRLRLECSFGLSHIHATSLTLSFKVFLFKVFKLHIIPHLQSQLNKCISGAVDDPFRGQCCLDYLNSLILSDPLRFYRSVLQTGMWWIQFSMIFVPR